MKDWLQFDWRAGWGTTEFEDKVADGKIKAKFPKRWADPLDREEAPATHRRKSCEARRARQAPAAASGKRQFR